MALKKITLSNFDNGRLEQQFQKAMSKIRRTLENEKFTGACKINIELCFKPGKPKGFVHAESVLKSTVPIMKTPSIFMLRDDEMLQDDTSGDAREPGLFSTSDGSLTGPLTAAEGDDD